LGAYLWYMCVSYSCVFKIDAWRERDAEVTAAAGEGENDDEEVYWHTHFKKSSKHNL